jgi:hypothetical protein
MPFAYRVDTLANESVIHIFAHAHDVTVDDPDGAHCVGTSPGGEKRLRPSVVGVEQAQHRTAHAQRN